MEDLALQSLLHRAKSCCHLRWCKSDCVLLNWMEVLGLALGKCEHNLVLGEDRCLMEVSGILTEQITSLCAALTGAP